MSDLALTKIESAFSLLSEVKTIEHAKDVIDIAATAAAYAKRIKASLSVMRNAAEIQTRAERLLGQMLADTPKSRGAAGIGTSAVPKENRTLADMGIGKKLSARSQSIASIPHEKFEDAVDNLKRGEGIPTPKQVIKVSNNGTSFVRKAPTAKVKDSGIVSKLKKLWMTATGSERAEFQDWFQQHREMSWDLPDRESEYSVQADVSLENMVKTKRILALHPELESALDAGKLGLDQAWLYAELGCWEYVRAREAACGQEVLP